VAPILTRSSDSFTITFPVTPRGQQRARHGRGGTYTPAATRQATAELRHLWLMAGRPEVPPKTFFTAKIVATYERPASTRLAYPRRSDVDNIAKLVLDALQGHAYDNDSYCAGLQVGKGWGERDQLRVTLAWRAARADAGGKGE